MSTPTTATHAFDLKGFPFTFSDASGIAVRIQQLAQAYLRGHGDAAWQHASEAIALTTSTVSLDEAVRAGTIGSRVEDAITRVVAAAGEGTKHAGGGEHAVRATQDNVVRLIAYWLRENTDWR